jgi:hypothetical protein
MLDKWDKIVKIGVGLLTLVGACGAAVVFLDSRYAHAEEVQRSITKQGVFVQSSYVEVRQEMVNDRIRQLEALRMQGKATVFDIEELQDKKTIADALRKKQEMLQQEMMK